MTAETPRHLQTLLRDRVGGFFHNTRHVPGETCEVCAGPASRRLCRQCELHRAQFGERLADRVLVLAYARGLAPQRHQSAYILRAYKSQRPSRKSQEDLELMIRAASFLHGDCVTKHLGRPWSAVTFIPSITRPGPEHPAAGLARQVQRISADRRFLLGLGPSIAVQGREVLPDRFEVPDECLYMIRDAHVLLVDDTWTSGSKAQSAALAVRQAGARTISVLCVARWCRHDWPDHRALLDSCDQPYDAMICPMTGNHCRPVTS